MKKLSERKAKKLAKLLAYNDLYHYAGGRGGAGKGSTEFWDTENGDIVQMHITELCCKEICKLGYKEILNLGSTDAVVELFFKKEFNKGLAP